MLIQQRPIQVGDDVSFPIDGPSTVSESIYEPVERIVPMGQSTRSRGIIEEDTGTFWKVKHHGRVNGVPQTYQFPPKSEVWR
jgi:hypothetical protein